VEVPLVIKVVIYPLKEMLEEMELMLPPIKDRAVAVELVRLALMEQEHRAVQVEMGVHLP
jgi:hypothetical protein